MRNTIFTVLLITISFCLTAQTFSIGPTAGFGHSWVKHVDNYFNSKYTAKFDPSWNAGLSLVYSTKKHFGLGIDVWYSAEGNKAHTPGFTTPEFAQPAATFTYHSNYIRVPVKLIYFFGKYEKAVRLKIYVGPDLGFLTEDKNVYRVDGGDTFKMDSKDQIKSFDFGAIVATGINIRLAHNTWLNTDAAWYQGLADVLKDYTPAYPRTGKNGNIEISAGLLFGF